MNDEKLLKHLADPSQRKAFIDFEQNSGTLGGAYLKENPNHKDLTPTQNLEAFRSFKETIDDKEKCGHLLMQFSPCFIGSFLSRFILWQRNIGVSSAEGLLMLQ